ncbi:MAG: CoA transferase [Dehalococcoidia bacterium]|nr:CoA transferase [Dehalococcoidia bacterium]MDZ4278457.1 CoA transferase [Dehalococcoidia bacterium]
MGDGRPLADVKVLDLTWVIATPAASRVLADYGATVVRVESTRRIDTARTFGPFLKGQPGPENSTLFQTTNAGKLGVTVNLASEGGRAVVLDLVRWADVVMEAFSPKTLPGLGLDYEAVRKVKPDIIMLSSCLMGQSGPLSRFAGYGSLAAAISGFYNITGWPDRPPAGPYNAYTDTIAPRYTLVSLLAALDHRRRTGQGQFIDQSQAESALHFLGPPLLDYTANRHVTDRMGNRDRQMAPHGVYPAAGKDRWVAIAVRSDEEWRALCEVMERPELADDARFATAAARLESLDELDRIVAGWTRSRDRYEIESALQARGVPASAVQDSHDLCADPQLAHRGFFVEVEHPMHGKMSIEASRVKLSRTPARVDRSAPTFGRDNQYVLETILGYGPERIAELAAEGALE